MEQEIEDAVWQTLIDYQVGRSVDQMKLPPNPLMSEQQEKEKKKAEVKKVFNIHGLKEPVEKGWATIFNELPKRLPPEEMEKITQEMRQVKDNFKKNSGEALNNMSPQQLFGLSDACMDHFYDLGYDLYMKADFAQSFYVFRFLSILDPYDYNYWFSAGASLVGQQDWMEALVRFAMAMIIQSQNPSPHLWSAHCYIYLDEMANAEKEIHQAEKLIPQATHQDQHQLQLENLRKLLKK